MSDDSERLIINESPEKLSPEKNSDEPLCKKRKLKKKLKFKAPKISERFSTAKLVHQFSSWKNYDQKRNGFCMIFYF